MNDGSDAICNTIKACFIALIAQQIRAGNNTRDERYCMDQAANLVQIALAKIAAPSSAVGAEYAQSAAFEASSRR